MSRFSGELNTNAFTGGLGIFGKIGPTRASQNENEKRRKVEVGVIRCHKKLFEVWLNVCGGGGLEEEQPVRDGMKNLSDTAKTKKYLNRGGTRIF